MTQPEIPSPALTTIAGGRFAYERKPGEGG